MENESKYPKEIMDIIGDDIEIFEEKLESAKRSIPEKGYDAQLKFAKNMYISYAKNIKPKIEKFKKESPILFEKFYGNK
jgi:hypothetical protein